jgi:SET domain-containing protein
MKKRERPPLVEVRHSPVHGYGVFALRRIRKGTTIMEYLGDRVSHEEADSRYENKDINDNHTFLFTVDSKTVIDGGVGGNDARFINHGCDPNCASASHKKRIFVEAVRTIQPGEELAYDYQIERDPEDPPNVDEIFACRCGAANCRGSMLVPRKKPRKKKSAAPAAKTTTRRGRKKKSRVAATRAGDAVARRKSGKKRRTDGRSAQRRRGG